MKFRLYLLILSLFQVPVLTHAASINSAQTGNFFTATTWLGGIVPGSADDVYIGSHTISLTLTSDLTINSLTMNWGSVLNITTSDPGYTLTITNGITFASEGSLSVDADVLISTATILINGYQSSIYTAGGSDLNITGLLNFNASRINFDLNGDLSANAIAFPNGDQTLFTVDAASTVAIATSLTLGSGPNTIDVYGIVNTNSMGLDGGLNTLNIYPGGQVNVTSDLSIAGSAGLDVGNLGDLNIGGNVNLTGGSYLWVDGNMDVVGDMTIENGVGGVNITGSLVVTGTLDINEMVISGGGDISAGTLICDIDCDTQISPTILPIELLYFKAIENSRFILLQWVTLTESNNAFFTVERSYDALNFDSIAFVTGAINSNLKLTYEYVDHALHFKTVYYRLKQTDFDGNNSYSDIVSVIYHPANTYSQALYYANHKLYINVQNLNQEQFFIKLITMQGAIAWQIKGVFLSHETALIVLPEILSGFYLLTFQAGQRVETLKIVIQ